MIIASDLDRTLIYSKRALEELGMPKNTTLEPIEERRGEMTAFMTTESLEALKKLSENSLFVPITTRTTEQFNRIFIFQNAVQTEYAVTSNGAEILFKGMPLPTWSEQIAAQMKKETCTQEELLSLIAKEKMDFKGKLRTAENLFFYFILEIPLSLEEKIELNKRVKQFGWRISQQGRKLYFMPNAVNKGVALQYLCDRTGMEAMAGAGDSVLDRDFLQHCRHRFVPLHGELAAQLDFQEAIVTESKGVLSGEEILKRFLELLPIQEKGVFSAF